MAKTISTYTTGITLTYPGDNPLSVTNTGTVAAANGNALYGPGGGWTIDNSGSISGRSLFLGGNGIQLGAGNSVNSGVVTNESGGVIAGSQYGVEIIGPGTFTNKSGGTITVTAGPGPGPGIQNGVRLYGAPGTVVNSGLITSSSYGVVETASGTVINNIGGTIAGANAVGVLIRGSGTITNGGLISDTGYAAVRFYGSNPNDRLIVNPGASFIGRVLGGYGTMELAAGHGTIGSFGTNLFNFTALQFDSEAQWTVSGDSSPNDLTALTITGFAAGDTIDLTDFAATSGTFANNVLTLSNGGAQHPTLHIQGSFAPSAFQVSSDNGTGTDITLPLVLKNPISGTYTGGVTLPDTLGSSIEVTGTITDPNGNALYGPGGGSKSWTIDNSGVIAGTNATGIQLGNYSTLAGVGASIITNGSKGSITGGNYGVYVYGIGAVTNQAGGAIIDTNTTGTYAAAVFITGDVNRQPGDQPGVEVDNSGNLSGATGVEELQGGLVTNSAGGTITGRTQIGVRLEGPGSIDNSGVINGTNYGVYLHEGGSVYNHAGAGISGATGAYIGGFNAGGTYGATFTNAGTVIGTGYAVRFAPFKGHHDYSLIVEPSAVFDGKVNGGGGTVELTYGSRIGTLSGFGDTITNFSTLQFDPGADWRISGNPGGLSTMAITGFAGRDIIDLTGFAAVDETFDPITNTLTLTGNSTPAVLNFPDLSSIDDFQFAPDGAGGTDIAPFGSGQPITWTATGSADWNTTSNWDMGRVPTGFDTAIIAKPVSTIATIATKASDVVGSLTIGDPSDTLEVGGTLQVVSTAAIGSGTLAVTDTGTLSAAAITDSGLLAFAGDHTLDNASLDLSGTLATLAVQDGILTLGKGETVTQTAPDAVLDGSGTIINQGIIDATGGSSLTITPVNFINQGTINAGETLTVGNPSGTWSNQLGTIANAFSLILDGTLATGDIGTMTNASNVIEAGLLDNKSATLTVGGATSLGAVTLASSGTVSGGTIVDQGSGFAFDGGTLDGVTYQGPLELTNPGDNATILGGLAVTATDATPPGTIDLTGDGAALDFRSTRTLAGVTLNIGASTTADVLQADGGGTFTIGPDVAIDSVGASLLKGSLVAGSNTTLNLAGTLNALSDGGTFTLADSGGTFSNNGAIIVGGDTLKVDTDIAAGSGTIEVGNFGTVDVAPAVVSAGQTLAFTDANGLLRLNDPASFAATITGIDTGATIDLTNFQAVDSSYANGVLTLGDGIGNTVTLHIPGTFTSDEFQLTPDGNGTDITWTPVGQTFTWTDGSDNWNTPTAWSLGSVPKGFDSAVIGDAASNTITVSDAEAINNLTLNGTNDTLEITVTGNLQAGPIAINSGTLAVRDGGSLAAPQIADHGLLDLGGNHELNNTPLSLGGTLQVSPSAFNEAGTLTLGQGVVLTQDLVSAVITSSGTDGNAAINQGTIVAGVPGGSMAIVPMNFTNTGTGGIRADNETLTIGNHVGSWSNKDGTIALSGTAALVLDGSLATTNIGKITGATGVTEAGLLDNTGGTLGVGTSTQLGTVNLANGAVVSGGTIVDHGNGFTFNSDGTFSGVTYKGPLELTEDSASLTINQGITVTGTGGAQPGTIDVTGKSDSLLFANQSPVLGQTLDNVTINIGNASGVDNLVPRFSGGTFTIGNSATIASTTPGANANLTAGSNTTVDFDGTLNATANNGAFAVSGAALSIFNNSGLINVGNGDTFSVGRDISGGTGTIDIGTNGVVDLAGSVATGQTIAFTDATGSLQLEQPGNVAATILNFAPGDRIELGKVPADSATWSADQLTISNAGTTVATLSLPGDYASSLFAVAGGPGASEVTVTATCFAAGTRILTPHGEVAVEHLREGDLVQTISGRAQPVSWIGHRRVNFRRHPNRQRILPVRVAAHAFGPGIPRRELLLSPDHAVFVEDVLIPIRHLINGSTVAQIERHAITYYHVELPRHDVLLANGLPAESYLEAGARNAFANGGGTIQLHPDFTPPLDHHSMLWEEHGYAPLVVTGAALERARHTVARQVRLAA